MKVTIEDINALLGLKHPVSYLIKSEALTLEINTLENEWAFRNVYGRMVVQWKEPLTSIDETFYSALVRLERRMEMIINWVEGASFEVPIFPDPNYAGARMTRPYPVAGVVFVQESEQVIKDILFAFLADLWDLKYTTKMCWYVVAPVLSPL